MRDAFVVVRQSYMPTTALISAHTPTRSLHCTRTTTTFSALRPNRKHVASSLLFIMKDHDGTSECSQDTIPDDPRHAAEHAPGLPRIPHLRSLATENSSSSMLKTLQRRVDLEPTNCISRVELGRALVACGRRTEGFESLAVAFELNSLCPGVKDGFREYYQAEIDADPTNVELHEGLAALCIDSARPEEAAECYKTCLNLDSSPAAAAVPAPDLAGNTVHSPDECEEARRRRARRDRWSVALFKCHASVCSWDDWDADARALRSAVRRHRAAGATTSKTRRVGGGIAADADGDDRNVGRITGEWRERFIAGVPWEEDEEDEIIEIEGERAPRRVDPGRREGDGGSNTVRSGGSPGSRSNDEVGGDVSSDDGDGGVVVDRPVLHPFDSLSAPLTIADCLAVAQQQSRAVLAAARKTAGANVVTDSGCEETAGGERRFVGREEQLRRPMEDVNGRLRLGYVSGDLMGTHPLTHLMQSTFGMHDRSNFEVFLYALNPSDGSDSRRRMEKEVEHFRDLSMLPAATAADAISADRISILVNLNGYAGTARSADIFALRPAPIAVSYMGFPGSMGSRDIVDYILADDVVIPPHLNQFYSEKVLRMPHCYFVNDYRQSGLAAIRSPAPVRSDYGLPSGGDEERGSGDVADDRRQRDDGEPGVWGHAGEQGSSVEQDQRQGLVGSGVDCVVLCNFNRLHKIDPHTFAAWMEILEDVPSTVLWLLDGGETARTNLRRRARLAGVDDARLFFAPLVGKDEHLRRLRSADLFLDTPLYNAHTVGCDALWAGVPMVTLQGKRMASRVGASLLQAAELPELVTDNMQAYTALARELARNDVERQRLRRKVQEARLTCPLFDTQQWVTHAEKLFRIAWERHQAGLPPENVTVDAGVVPIRTERE